MKFKNQLPLKNKKERNILNKEHTYLVGYKNFEIFRRYTNSMQVKQKYKMEFVAQDILKLVYYNFPGCINFMDYYLPTLFMMQICCRKTKFKSNTLNFILDMNYFN